MTIPVYMLGIFASWPRSVVLIRAVVNNCWLSGVVSSFSQQFFTWLCALQGSALKQAFKWTINSYENEFLHVHFHANQTHFHDSVCTGTHCETR